MLAGVIKPFVLYINKFAPTSGRVTDHVDYGQAVGIYNGRGPHSLTFVNSSIRCVDTTLLYVVNSRWGQPVLYASYGPTESLGTGPAMRNS